ENGIMTRYPLFYYYTHKVEVLSQSSSAIDGVSAFYSYLHSNPVVPYSYSANGSQVGYEKVTESMTNNGKTVHEFYVQPDKLNFTLDPISNTTAPISGDPYQFLALFNFSTTYIPGVPSTANFLNGKLKAVTHYSKDKWGMADKRTSYTYNVLNRQSLWNFKWIDRSANPNALDHKFYTCFYPLNMGKIVPVMTQITDCEPKIVN